MPRAGIWLSSEVSNDLSLSSWSRRSATLDSMVRRDLDSASTFKRRSA